MTQNKALDFLPITSKEHPGHSIIYPSYEKTFPSDERRDEKELVKLYQHPKVNIFHVLEGLTSVGYVIQWDLSTVKFIEHFEVFESFRGQGYGQKILSQLKKEFSRLVLECEPEDFSPTAKRRLEFYYRQGFTRVDISYIQPAYSEDKKPLPLELLSSFPVEKPSSLVEEIYDVVY